jgi:hypothetical protein
LSVLYATGEESASFFVQVGQGGSTLRMSTTQFAHVGENGLAGVCDGRFRFRHGFLGLFLATCGPQEQGKHGDASAFHHGVIVPESVVAEKPACLFVVHWALCSTDSLW